MRAALLALGLALGWAAPAAAQAVEPAPAASAAAGMEEPSASGPIVLLTGPDTLLLLHGTAPLDPAERLCLLPKEVAVLASDRVTFQLTGEGCFIASVAEGEAFANELRVFELQEIDVAVVEYDAAIASGDEAMIDQALKKLQAAERDARDDARGEDEASTKDAMIAREAALKGGEGQASKLPRAPSASPTPSVRKRAAAPRARTGSPRLSRGPAVPPRAIIFRLASGSPAVLTRYPKGTPVQRSTALCLNHGEQATILGSHGQSVTYTGPGCLKRQAKPSGENLGGFTFGWRAPEGRAITGRAK